MALQRTLVLIKPDGVERKVVGEIITRFEKIGLKIIGLKMIQADDEFARRHYTEDLAIRRGEKVRDQMVRMLTSSPVVAIALEGVEAIELVRKHVGDTEPKKSAPGTIRGDYAHISYAHADEMGSGVFNIVHASSSEEDAKNELSLWFSEGELCQYSTVHDKHVFGQGD
jgi:nucleoside-diphosphate kinase